MKINLNEIKIKLSKIKTKLNEIITRLNRKQKILAIIIGALIFVGILLIIFWPSINQAIYYGKVEAIKSEAVSQSETIKTKGSIGENETLSAYLSRIKNAIDKMDVEKRLTDLNENYPNVSKLSFEEADLLTYDQKADLALSSFEVITKTADNVKTLKGQFNDSVKSENVNMTQEFALLSSSISVSKDTLNSIEVEELKPIAKSVIQIFDELGDSIDKYTTLSNEWNKFSEQYNAQMAEMQSINSWKILRDNAVMQEYKDMCQQKVDEFTAKAKDGIDNIKKLGENMQNYKEQFESSYASLLKRLGINNVDYSTKKQIASAIDSAKKLIFSE